METDIKKHLHMLREFSGGMGLQRDGDVSKIVFFFIYKVQASDITMISLLLIWFVKTQL